MSEKVRLKHIKPPFVEGDGETAVVDLSRYGVDGQEEEIWLEKGDSDGFLVCSIPFCIDDLSLFDRVRLKWGSETLEVCERSGRGVLRVLIHPRVEFAEREELASKLSRFLIGEDLAHEWNGAGFVSIDFPSSEAALRVEDEIQKWGGILWEWGSIFDND